MPLKIACIGWIVFAARAETPTGARLSFTDLRGKEFKDAEVLRIEPGLLVVMTGDGVSRVPAPLLPEELRVRFGFAGNASQSGSTQALMAARSPADAPQPAREVPLPEEIKLSALIKRIEKAREIIRDLETKRAELSEEHKKERAAAAKRYHDLTGTTPTPSGDAMTPAAPPVRSHDARFRRLPPRAIPRDEHPHVVRLQNLIDGYDVQIAAHKRELVDLEAERSGLEDSARQQRAAAQKRARQEADRANLESILEARAAARAAEAKRKIEETERKESEELRRKEAADVARREAEEAERKRIAAVSDEIDRLIGAGELQGAYLKLREFTTDDRIAALGNDALVARAIGQSLQISDKARDVSHKAVAASALRLAVNLDSRSTEVTAHLTTFLGQIKDLANKRDFKTASRQMDILDGLGIEEQELFAAQQREIANAVLDAGWAELRCFNAVRAGAAVGLARRLWQNNPRLGWLRTCVVICVLLAVLAGILGIVKLTERIYWWISR